MSYDPLGSAQTVANVCETFMDCIRHCQETTSSLIARVKAAASRVFTLDEPSPPRRERSNSII